jgi:hypothetical protein
MILRSSVSRTSSPHPDHLSPTAFSSSTRSNSGIRTRPAQAWHPHQAVKKDPRFATAYVPPAGPRRGCHPGVRAFGSALGRQYRPIAALARAYATLGKRAKAESTLQGLFRESRDYSIGTFEAGSNLHVDVPFLEQKSLKPLDTCSAWYDTGAMTWHDLRVWISGLLAGVAILAFLIALDLRKRRARPKPIIMPTKKNTHSGEAPRRKAGR